MIALTRNPIDQLVQQHLHWMQATKRLSRLDNLASSYAWKGTNKNVRDLVIRSLDKSIEHVNNIGNKFSSRLKGGSSYDRLWECLQELREQYLRAETTIHFYTDALNTRTNPEMATMLTACDILCRKSMEAILPHCGLETPYVLTYIDKGVGASILKSGMRLWDGNVSPVAAVKITLHNLYRPTAIIHESGHQIAHVTNWNTELGTKLYERLKSKSMLAADAYQSWASEIAADCFAFVHTGYAAVGSLHNVVSGRPQSVFAFHEGDPHPVSYCRVLLNLEMARFFYGRGPWDDLEENFKQDYPIEHYTFSSVPLIQACVRVLPDVVDVCLRSSFEAFRNKTLSEIIDPMCVSPAALERLQHLADGSLINSHAWIDKECLKLLALTGYRVATGNDNIDEAYRRQELWMAKLGASQELN
jgi:hypothetical protein